MKMGEDLALEAMKRDFKRLSRLADKAKKEAEEAMCIGSEMVAIHNEFVEIVKAKITNEASMKKLEALQVRSKKAQKIQEKSLIKLFDKEHETAFNRDELGREIQKLEYYKQVRQRA
jgi:hypothetical protein